MKRLIYQVYVGQPSNLYDACIGSVSNYCKKYNIDHIVQKNSILRIQPDLSRTGRSKEAVSRLGYLPIFEKENALLGYAITRHFYYADSFERKFRDDFYYFCLIRFRYGICLPNIFISFSASNQSATKGRKYRYIQTVARFRICLWSNHFRNKC